MKKTQKFYQERLYNPKQLYARILNDLPIHPTEPMKKHNGFKFALALVAVTALALTLGFQLKQPAQNVAYAVVSVDINPSFELTAAEDGSVIGIEAINADAETIVTDDLIGLPIEQAVEQIIVRATEAGFINTEDDAEDYVIVSTVLLDESNPNLEEEQDELDDLISDEIENSEEIDEDTVVSLIKATLQQKFEAEGKEVPLGLFIINGMINVDGELMSVSEFVSDPQNLKKLEQKAHRLTNNVAHFTSLIELYLAVLAENGVDISAYEARLTTEGEDLEALKDELEELAEAYDVDDDDMDDVDDDDNDDDDDDDDDSETVDEDDDADDDLDDIEDDEDGDPESDADSDVDSDDDE